MGTNDCKISVFSSKWHLGTEHIKWRWKKTNSRLKITWKTKKSSSETLRKQKLVHPLRISNSPVDSHKSNTRQSSCSRKNKIPRDYTRIRKPFTSFASEHPVLALPQHVTLKPKWHWEELHKHGHVVNPAGACCCDVTTWFFSLVFCMPGLYNYYFFLQFLASGP